MKKSIILTSIIATICITMTGCQKLHHCQCYSGITNTVVDSLLWDSIGRPIYMKDINANTNQNLLHFNPEHPVQLKVDYDNDRESAVECSYWNHYDTGRYDAELGIRIGSFIECQEK